MIATNDSGTQQPGSLGVLVQIVPMWRSGRYVFSLVIALGEERVFATLSADDLLSQRKARAAVLDRAGVLFRCVDDWEAELGALMKGAKHE